MIKKLLTLLLCFSLFSSIAFAGGLSSAYQATKEIIMPTESSMTQTKCPIYADTPSENIDRPTWELMLRMNIMDFPTGGPPAVHTDNFDFGLIHNLSSQLFAYIWAGNRSTIKNEYAGSEYATEIESQMIFAGVGFYFTPVLKVFGGAGQIVASDKDGKDIDYGTPMERGIGLDIPVMGYKVEVSYRFVEAQIQSGDEAVPVEELTGEGTFSAMSISLIIPF